MKVLLIVMLLSAYNTVFSGEKEKAQAFDIGHEAIQMVEKGKYTEAIDLFSTAMELDPEHWLYPYEKALCYYELKDYHTSKRMLDSLVIHGISNPRVFQLLGNSEARLGNLKRANAIYSNGLKRYPDAGRLYLEIGLTEIAMEKYDEAEKTWEKGIIKQPDYAPNYYHLSKYLAETREYFWSALYAELYLLQSYDSHKFEEISKLLWDNYKKLSKSKNSILKYKVEKHKDKVIYKLSSSFEKYLNEFTTISQLTEIRKKIFSSFTKKDIANNTLLQHIKKVINSNMFLEYNYWIFAVNNISELQKWFKKNSKKYVEFEKWNTKNRISFNENSKILIRNAFVAQ